MTRRAPAAALAALAALAAFALAAGLLGGAGCVRQVELTPPNPDAIDFFPDAAIQQIDGADAFVGPPDDSAFGPDSAGAVPDAQLLPDA